MKYRYIRTCLLLLVSVMLITACTAGSENFTVSDKAGFWAGLWHGIISVITLIIHIFNDSVRIYEVSNTGGWYDFGFLMGVIMIWGGGSKVTCKSKERRERDKEWEEVGEKVELKIMRKMKEWAEDESVEGEASKEEWEEIGKKVEKKLKRKIREWAEKE